jgi:hypothetical protein
MFPSPLIPLDTTVAATGAEKREDLVGVLKFGYSCEATTVTEGGG